MVDTQSLSEYLISEVSIPVGTPLSSPVLIDKILGLIYGNALGDALGVRTEFLSSAQSKSIWRDQDYSLLNWPEPRRFPEGDWTDDTDQMVLILQGYLEHSSIKPTDFAKKLIGWRNNGFPELGDVCGTGIGYTVMSVMRNDNFLWEPSLASLQVWAGHRCNLAANGALMRTSILGVINYQDLTKVIKQTIDIGITTHSDPKSLTACVAETSAIALMLQGVSPEQSTETAKSLSRVFIEKYTLKLEEVVTAKFNEEIKESFLKNKSTNNYSRELLDKYLDSEFDALLPIDGEDLGYAYICLGCAMWAVKQDVWIEAIGRMILEGGDADTNAAAAGAILGCKLGCSNLPQNLIAQLTHKAWLDEQIVRLLVMMGLQPTS